MGHTASHVQVVRLRERAEFEPENRELHERVIHLTERVEHFDTERDVMQTRIRTLEAQVLNLQGEKIEMQNQVATMESEIVESRRGAVSAFKPGKSIYAEADIQYPELYCFGLYGDTGVGKTSVINSILSIFHSKFPREEWLPTVPPDSTEGNTIYRRKVKISRSVYLVDNRGIPPTNWGNEFVRREIIQQLGKR